MSVTGQIDSHVGNGTHGSNILVGMVGHTKGAVADASADADKGYICIGIANINLCLFHASC
ncbi:hypothetical protein D3C81_2343150 [compost metagenome]